MGESEDRKVDQDNNNETRLVTLAVVREGGTSDNSGACRYSSDTKGDGSAHFTVLKQVLFTK